MTQQDSSAPPTGYGWRRLVDVATTAPYSWYLLGQAADTIALWMQRLALGWLVWELTQSAAWLGSVSFLKFAPTMVLGLFGGVLADRFSRGHIVLAAQAVTVLKAVLVVVLLITGGLNLPILVALMLMVGIAVGLSQASSKTVVNELVSRDRLGAAIALNSVVFNVAQLIGPALAGLMLVFFGMIACFVVIALLFAVNFAVFTFILPHIRNAARPSSEPMFRSIATALGFCMRHPAIAPLLVLHLAFTFAVRPILDMLPAFAGGVLNEGIDAVSLLTSTVGAGAIISGLYLAGRRPGPGLLGIVLASMVVLGIAMLGFAMAPTLLIALPLAALIGGGMTIRAAGIQTLIQLSATEDLRGRVMSIFGLFLNSGAALGGLGVGLLADAIGLRQAIALSAVASLLVLAIVMMRRHQMRDAVESKDMS